MLLRSLLTAKIDQCRNWVTKRTIVFGFNIQSFLSRQALKGKSFRILIDSSVLSHAVIHETYRIKRNDVMWGEIALPNWETVSAQVYEHDSTKPVAKELKFLIPIVNLLRQGIIEGFTSAELEQEQFRQPAGRFRGYWSEDRSLFDGFELNSIDGYVFFPKENAIAQSSRIKSRKDATFESLIPYFDQAHSLDVWHLATACRHGLDAYLTFDFAFKRTYDQAKLRKGFPNYLTKLVTPTDLASVLKLIPIPLILMTVHEQQSLVSFDVTPRNSRMPGRRRKDN